MKRITLANKSFFEEVQTFLEADERVCFNVRGTSMLPFLRNGDKVLLVSVKGVNVYRGHIVLAQTCNGMILHRVVHIGKEVVSLAGDANANRIEKVNVTDIKGVVIDAYRDNISLNINSFWMRLGALLWYVIRPFRGYLLTIFFK